MYWPWSYSGWRQRLALATAIIHNPSLLAAMSLLEGMPGVLRVALSGNHLRLITEPQMKQKDIRAALNQNGLAKITITRTTPDLEDVFLTLAKR